MDAFHPTNHADLILKRTIHISNVPTDVTPEELESIFSTHGEVIKVKLESSPKDGQHMAFVQFESEEAARDSLTRPSLTLGDKLIRITPSRVTIDVIPPTDAVFGKPITVGKHVMAVNPSKMSNSAISRQESTLRAVHQAAVSVLQAISERTGTRIDADELERLRRGAYQLSRETHHETMRARGSPH